MQIPFLKLVAFSLLAASIVGCVSFPHAIVPCPLTYSEQEKELLTIVPKGIRRDEALRRLTAAGVEGSFGISHRVYYCDLWNRPNGDRWHVNVALLFDDAGRLYKTQMAECDVAVVPQEKNPPGPASSDAASRQASGPAADAGLSSPVN